MPRTRSQYEECAHRLIGKRLVGVRYFEIKYEAVEPAYHVPGFPGHLLDFGCELTTEDGLVHGVMWDAEFVQYGVGILGTSLSSELIDPRVWDVSSEDHWKSLMGKCIVSADVYWSWVQYEGGPRKYYPQDVALGFEDGAVVYFCASQYVLERDELFGTSDDITIIFGNFAANRYRVGPYARDS